MWKRPVPIDEELRGGSFDVRHPTPTERTIRLLHGHGAVHGQYDVFMRRKRLVEARRATGKTQEQIADDVGVDRTTLGKWERDESTPQPAQRARFARALGVPLCELDTPSNMLPE